MMENLMENLILPVFRRFGSFVAGWLVSAGWLTDTAQAEALVVALGAVAYDLWLSYRDRKNRPRVR